jgi:predicted metal-binding membrane protein
MTAAVSGQPSGIRRDVQPAVVAMRSRLGLVGLLFALAAVGWWWTQHQMQGMSSGPWGALGSVAWFLGVWVVMMAAMMLPSVAPTVALYSRMTRNRSALLPLTFVGGYLVTWAVAGMAAVAVGAVASAVAGSSLEWNHAGRVLAGATLLLAAGYQLSPIKDACLGKCRSPLGMLLGSWRDGAFGALQMGMKNGTWCVGCCWALMASLFALGVMNDRWMAVVAGLIAMEKTLPWKRAATYGTAIVLLALGVLVLVAPSAIPGLTIPHGSRMSSMQRMGSVREITIRGYTTTSG